MISFEKFNGAGNDFVMINNLDKSVNLTSEEIKRICDRHFGIGADGIILLETSKVADCFMNYFNADGTIAQMCGNGARCTAKFFKTITNRNQNILNIETRAGIKEVTLNDDETYSVNMGAPVFDHADFPNEQTEIEGHQFNFVSMGNPHAVTFVTNLKNIDIKTIGPKIEKDFHFPNKINVEFVEKISDNYYKVAVWERGSGETLACGTGACAVYSIIEKIYQSEMINELKEITLEFPGGKLFLSKNLKEDIILRGPAIFTYSGKIEL